MTGTGAGKVKDKRVPIQTLRRVAAECEQERAEAILQGNWRGSLEKKLQALIWRTIALALEISLVPAFDPSADRFALAEELREHCRSALDQLEPSTKKADRFHKVRTIGEVLDGILDVVGVLEKWTGGDSDEPFFLAFAATGLGQADVELGFAESGHWEQVARWQKQKSGRKEGWTKAWKEAAAPEIRAWIEGEPTIGRQAVIERLGDWLKIYAKNHRGERIPDESSLGKALVAMHKKQVITLPWRN